MAPAFQPNPKSLLDSGPAGALGQAWLARRANTRGRPWGHVGWSRREAVEGGRVLRRAGEVQAPSRALDRGNSGSPGSQREEA